MPKTAPAANALSLCAFRVAGSSEWTGAAAAPSRLVICPMGKHDARERGQVIVSSETVEGFAARQSAAKLGTRLALDFEHNTVPGTSAYLAEREPRGVAAWATCTAGAEGVVYENIEWTPPGLEAWKNKQFQDISPAVFRRADGTVLAVHSAALCRHGEIDGLTIEAAAAPRELAPFFAALSASLNLTTTEPDMKPTPELIALCAALGVTLTETADEAAVATALKEAAGNAAAAMKKPEGMTAEQKTEITALTARIDAFEKAEDARQRQALIDGALAEGKVIALSVEMRGACPLNVLEDHIKQLKPGVVPLTRTSSTGAQLGDKAEAFTAEDLEVFKRMGISEADARKGLGLPEKKAA